jgi:hypothetical protein
MGLMAPKAGRGVGHSISWGRAGSRDGLPPSARRPTHRARRSPLRGRTIPTPYPFADPVGAHSVGEPHRSRTPSPWGQGSYEKPSLPWVASGFSPTPVPSQPPAVGLMADPRRPRRSPLRGRTIPIPNPFADPVGAHSVGEPYRPEPLRPGDRAPTKSTLSAPGWVGLQPDAGADPTFRRRPEGRPTDPVGAHSVGEASRPRTPSQSP